MNFFFFLAKPFFFSILYVKLSMSFLCGFSNRFMISPMKWWHFIFFFVVFCKIHHKCEVNRSIISFIILTCLPFVLVQNKKEKKMLLYQIEIVSGRSSAENCLLVKICNLIYSFLWSVSQIVFIFFLRSSLAFYILPYSFGWLHQAKIIRLYIKLKCVINGRFT